MAHRAALWFVRQGLSAESHVACLLDNRSELLIVALGARLAGLYFTPISTHLSQSDTPYIINDCGARIVFYSEPTKSMMPLHGQFIGYKVDADPDGLFRPVDSAEGELLTPLPERPRGRDLVYSSGTTGRPKGVRRPLTPTSTSRHRKSRAYGSISASPSTPASCRRVLSIMPLHSAFTCTRWTTEAPV